MRHHILAFLLLLAITSPSQADVHVGVGISVPGISIGINVPSYPRLVRVPGHPVYYDPYLDANLFFYDGLYWVFVDDDWYVSDWYDGPWSLVARFDVPVFLLRIPVRYYHRPPPYFRHWHPYHPPRWDEHWGHGWRDDRHDWNRKDVLPPPPAPLPSYQHFYSGKHYPREPDKRYTIRKDAYHYTPHDPVSQRHFEYSGKTPHRAPDRIPERSPGQPRNSMPDQGRHR